MGEKRGLQALQAWCRKVTEGYPNVRVADMSMSWKDGLAFCAIIHHYRPDLIDFGSLSKEDILLNNQLAFTVAEQSLGIPALLDAEDMLKYAEPDKLSIATYVSQLYQYFERSCKGSPAKISMKRPFTERPHNFTPQPVVPAKVSSRGFLRDDKCSKCQNRVFLLERLIVDGKLYHRTCFVCIKCNFILKPGAYAAGDEPGTYECVVCPNEEEEEENRRKISDSLRAEENSKNNSSMVIDAPPIQAAERTPEPELKLSKSFASARQLFLDHSLSDQKEHSDSVSETKSDSCEEKTEALHSKGTETSPDETTKEDEMKNIEVKISNDVSIEQNETATESQHNEPSQTDSNSDECKQDIISSKCESEHPENVMSVCDTGQFKENKIETLPTLHEPPMTTESTANVVEDSAPVKTPRKTRGTFTKLELSKANSFDPSKGIKGVSSSMPVITSPTYKLPQIKSVSPSSHNLGENKFCSLTDTQGDNLGEANAQLRKNYNLTRSTEYISPFSTPRVSDIRKSFEAFSKDEYLANKELKTSPGLIRPSYIKSRENIRKSTSSEELTRVTNELPKDTSVQSADVVTSLNNTIRIIPEDDSREPTPNIISEETKPNDSVATNIQVSEINLKQNISQDDDHQVDNIEVNDEKLSSKSEKQVIPCLEYSIHEDKTTEEKIDEEESKDKSEIAFDSSQAKEVESSTDNDKALLNKEINNLKEDRISCQSEASSEIYPDDLNPFGSDEEEEEDDDEKTEEYPDDLNPFGDSDTENGSVPSTSLKVEVQPKKPRSKSYDDNLNPFGNDDNDEEVTVPSPVPSLVVSPARAGLGVKKRPAPKPPGLTPDRSNSPSVRPVPSPMSSKKPAPKPPSSPSPRKVDSKAIKEQNNLSMAQKQKVQEPPPPATNTFGYWKKKKRPAPSVPVPPRRQVVKIPVKEIQSELAEIDEKQQELESQGRELEMMIRDQNQDGDTNPEEEDLILQLFELVNQKNVLFRRQAELMYIKRSQKLEEEQADLEFQIRCLMCKPEKQKTEDDVKKEENLLQKLLEVVELRNEIVESMDLDRQRVQDEDLSIQEQFSHRRGSLHALSQENVSSSDETKRKKKNTLKHKFKRDKEKNKDKTKDSSDSLWKFHRKDKKKS